MIISHCHTYRLKRLRLSWKDGWISGQPGAKCSNDAVWKASKIGLVQATLGPNNLRRQTEAFLQCDWPTYCYMQWQTAVCSKRFGQQLQVSPNNISGTLKGQGHQGIFFLVKGTLWGNCKFLLEHFKGTEAMTRMEAIAFVASLKCNDELYSSVVVNNLIHNLRICQQAVIFLISNTVYITNLCLWVVVVLKRTCGVTTQCFDFVPESAQQTTNGTFWRFCALEDNWEDGQK